MLREFFFPGIANAFPASPPLPFFPSYSPTTSLTPTIFPANFTPPIIQQYSMDVQTALSRDTVLDIGYHGSRGSKLIQVRAFDQAVDATIGPIRGETTNTLANLPLRQPIEGFNSAFA